MNNLVANYANIIAGGNSTPTDTTGPTVNIEVVTVTDTSIKVKTTATDESGLAESETYRFLLNEEEKGKNTTGEYTFEGLTAATKYTIKVEVKDKVGNLGSATKEVTTSVPSISTAINYTGYYADVNRDGTVDGVIYADLAIGGSGQWENSNGTYTIPQISSGLKSYTISETKYNGKFGDKEIITAVEGSQGIDRFYVMALSDISEYVWNFTGNMSVVTQGDFGTGKTNTLEVMARHPHDLWQSIQTQVQQGWFVPSSGEWSAFVEELGVSSKYSSCGLSYWYWSSSQTSTEFAWTADFASGRLMVAEIHRSRYVRLSTTF